MKQTPDYLRFFAPWHFYGVLVAFLLTLHGSAMAAPQILVAHPVVHGLAQELVRGTSIELVQVTPVQLPPARHPAFLAGRGLEALQKAAVQAEAVLTLRSIWPDDQLYPLARRNNIRIVEIDAAQPVEGDLPGISLSTGDNAINAQPWLDGNNLSRMSGILADALKAVIQGYLPLVAVLIVVVSAALTLWATLLKPKWSQSGSAFANIFNVHWIWLLLRVLGAVFIVMIYTQTGPEWVISKFTGGVILNDLNPVLIPFFFFAVMMLPFLVDYGLMEYIGTLLSKPFQKIFKLPGRSAASASTGLTW